MSSNVWKLKPQSFPARQLNHEAVRRNMKVTKVTVRIGSQVALHFCCHEVSWGALNANGSH